MQTKSQTENFAAKVLVVDDDKNILKLISRHLQNENYLIKTARSGHQALEILRGQDDFDLVILDLVMREMNGFDVCVYIRKEKSLFELPILILTSNSNTQDVVMGFNSGANDYVAKPYDSHELIARSKTLIKLKKMTQAHDVLQEAIELKNQFLHMTIHDLKNPLNVIVGLAKMMQRDFPEDSEHNELLGLVVESSDLMLNLIHELLDAAKIESGKLVLNLTTVNLNEIVESIYEKTLNVAKKKNQKIIVDKCPDEESFIKSDHIRLQEIVDNLVSNAVKYSPYDKNIHISTSKYTYKNGRNYIRLIVKDEGPGLTQDDMGKIFGKFQKLSARPTGGESSSGLGLAIVKQLVELHDGIINVESEPGKGASFIVDFPMAELDF